MISLVSFLITQAYAGPPIAVVIGDTSSSGGFREAVQSMTNGLMRRGFQVDPLYYSEAHPRVDRQGVIAHLSRTLERMERGDRFLLSLECHGSIERASDFRKHICCLSTDCSQSINANALMPALKAASRRGVRIALLDHGCGGGGTAELISRSLPAACALSTTTTDGPGITGFPDFGRALTENPRIRNLENLSHWGTAEIFRRMPGRTQQKVTQSACARDYLRIRGTFTNYMGSNIAWSYRDTSAGHVLYPGELPVTGHDAVAASARERMACENRERFKAHAETALVELASRIAEAGGALGYQALPGYLREAYAQAGFEWRGPRVLRDGIRALVERIEALRAEMARLGTLAAAEGDRLAREARTGGRTPGDRTALNKIRARFAELEREIRDQAQRVSVALAVAEDLECQVRRNPCRDFEL